MEGMEGESVREYRSRYETRVAFNRENQRQFLNISALMKDIRYIIFKK